MNENLQTPPPVERAPAALRPLQIALAQAFADIRPPEDWNDPSYGMWVAAVAQVGRVLATNDAEVAAFKKAADTLAPTPVDDGA